MPKLLLLALALLLFAVSASSRELSASDLDKRRKALSDLLREHWEFFLRVNPEYASLLGDRRYNDQSSDFSEAALKRTVASAKKFAARLEKIDTTAFPEQEVLNKTLLLRNLRQFVEDVELKEYEMPVTQISGIHLDTAQIVPMLPFATTKDYDDYAKRLRNFPKQIDDTIANMRKGMRDRLMPPKFLLEKVGEQAADLAADEAEKSPFALPLETFPDAVPSAERERIRTGILAAIRTSVLPAYQKFAAFVKDEYAPRGRTHVGMWALPDGAKRYAVRIRQNTTTSSLTAEEIHEIGLREVARIEGEMLAIARKLGFSDLKSFRASLDTNPDLRAKSREQILDLYRNYIDQMYAKLPQLFGRLPKQKVVVEKVEEFREKESPGASYEPGAPDGSRPGRVMVNTGEATSRKTISMESTAYHEGVAGHHMQIAIAQELTGLPEFRRFASGFTAYDEGWALYSETLGKEVGFYTNPYNDYGRLQDEMLRAIRLVVDTGLHAKRWTREQVVQFFHDHTSEDEVEVQNETDRYIVWPGQALGYKIGSLKIAELRERARRELGTRFDIRAFHDEVLGAGPLPLDELEKRIEAWIAWTKR
jgi:uncharacterized protein (DUF885 family)